MRNRVLVAVVSVVALALAVAGCGDFFTSNGGGGGGGTPHFAYLAASASANLSGFTVDTTTGALTAMTGLPALGANAAATPNALDSDSNGNFLFVALAVASNNLAGFAINHTTGALTAVPGSPYTVAGGALRGVTLDPQDRFLYTVDSVSNVQAFAVNTSTGQLTAVGTAQSVGGVANGILIDPSGQFVYVPFPTGIATFSINSDGSLTSQTPVTTASGCTAFQSVIVEPTDHFLFAVDGQTSGNVCGFQIGASGVLTALSPVTTAADNTPVALAVNPGGQFLFVADKGSNKMSEFSISNAGALSQFTGSPVNVGAGPDALTTDPSGSFLYVVNGGANTVSLFTLASNGALTPSAASTSTGTSPSAIVVVP
jgi:6-phosphogluconolactonase (cycloisomerase 2 family)